MNKQIISLTATVIVTLGLATVSCKNDKKTAIPSSSSAFDTIKPILTTNCVACHSGINVESSFNTLFTKDKYLGSINHTSGFRPMPEGGSKLSDSDINKFVIYFNSVK